MSAIRNNERYAKFIELMPKNKYNVTKSAIEAGFGKTYAAKQQSLIAQRALEFQLQRAEMLARAKGTSLVEKKNTMAEIVGLTRENIMENLRFIAEQTKDLSTRLKVVAPLAKEFGVILDEEKQNVTVPILNVTVRDNGSTKPPLPPTLTEDSSNIDCTT